MQLADAAWRLVPAHSTADSRVWEMTLHDVRGNTASGLERYYCSLPTGQQKTLRAIANGNSIYGTTASFLDLAPGTARDAAHVLVGNGVLRHDDRRFRVIDPILCDWLQQRFATPL